MGYQLRMHNDIRDWLTGLRATEPELARLVGEAVLALIEAGERLGPPLVLPLEPVLRPEDPRKALDYSYQRQLEVLTRIRRGVADVATSRKRVELQVNQLEEQAARLARQREQALEAGHEVAADRTGGLLSLPRLVSPVLVTQHWPGVDDLAGEGGYSSPSASGSSSAAASASTSSLASASASASTSPAATSADASSGGLSLMSPNVRAGAVSSRLSGWSAPASPAR
jgi:hypothetical protein